MRRNTCLALQAVLMLLCLSLTASVFAADQLTVVDRPDATPTNDYYVSNRQPLLASQFIELPLGSIKPQGWLLSFLQRQRDGLTGNLGRISAWLQKDDNAWLSKDGKGEWGWEELPYWLKGYGDMAYILNDADMIAETKIWIEGALNSQREDGDFGPDHRFGDGTRDYWANMIMLFCLQSYYDYSQDQRVLDLMSRYFKYQLSVPDEAMLTGYWQRMRGGDNLYSIYWLYNHTGEKWLLDVATKMDRNTANWRMENDLPNWHNVNITQAFGEPATYYLQSHDPKDLEFAYKNFFEIRKCFGQVPGGLFGGDENCRVGFDDPRQGVETCGMVEQMLSDELLMRITGDPFWADNCEDVAFNTYPAAVMPDFRSLRYLTSPNMVLSDQANHRPGIDNGGPFLIMNPFSSRCCQHNHSHGWPYYAKSLWWATPDNGVCAAMYAASEVTAKVGDGTEITFKEATHYPFEEQVRLTLSTPKKVQFPLYLRIPGWCEKPAVMINGKKISLKASPRKYIRIDRTWSDGDTVTLDMPMDIKVHTWTQNHNSVSVNYGPLTFSLKIEEDYRRFDSIDTAIGDSKWQKDVDTSQWPSFEIHPVSAWNYGLVLDARAPENSFKLIKKGWPHDNFPFTLDSVPLAMEVKAKKIPTWTLDRHGLCAVLQDSPVRSNEPVETVTLVPMGAARLRISAFPTIGDGPEATDWQPEMLPQPALYKTTASHVSVVDDISAMCDGVTPASSGDHNVPRFTWWDHRGTREWVQYDFEERTVSQVSVYWFDDTGVGQCRVPKSWRLLYKDGDDWRPVEKASGFGTLKDDWNSVTFTPVKTTALRLEVQLRPNVSGGILEWKVD
jgi:hypothetical protein